MFFVSWLTAKFLICDFTNPLFRAVDSFFHGDCRWCHVLETECARYLDSIVPNETRECFRRNVMDGVEDPTTDCAAFACHDI